MINENIKELYEIFKGLPVGNAIVRNNQQNDAFEILSYDLIFRKNKIGVPISIDDLEELEKVIVPPPDEKIDIFYEEELNDEQVYHIVQVKNSKLSESQLEECFSDMKRTIKDYLNDPKNVAVNLRNIISASSFDKDCKNNCIYYVVHSGQKKVFRGQKDDENVITLEDLELIQQSIVKYCVPNEKIRADKSNNFLDYKYFEAEETLEVDENGDIRLVKQPRAVMCNLNGYDLAIICNKYFNSAVGRNILFSQNFREAITKKSKTFNNIRKTIDEEPKYFWYYNNGISIITEDLDIIPENGIEYVHLKNFSIVNGAQTTSTLGSYLQQIERDREYDKIDNLKSVYVTARIIETKSNDKLSRKIATNNNTQNPLSSRDMISINDEQNQVQKRYYEGEEPKIFIFIRTGEVLPKSKKAFYKHQTVMNDELAQLVFASFLRSPYTAKDKKNTLFNVDSTATEYKINEEYSKIFNYCTEDSKKGELFKRTKEEINELLFVKYLHNKAKKVLKDNYNESISVQEEILKNPNSDQSSKDSAIDIIEAAKKSKQINNINLFYNITLYYEFKRQFDILLKASDKKYDYTRFYGKNKKYDQELVYAFAELFNSETIILINELGSSDPSKFVRLKSSQDLFLKKLTEKLTSITYKNRYKNFIDKFKK